MLFQFTLTVPEAKKVIALGAKELPEIRHALQKGKIVLKGGSTVSSLAEELIGQKLALCGRVTPLGTKGPIRWPLDAPHSVLIEGGKVTPIDDREEEAIMGLKREDVFVIGANALDSQGVALMMAGSFLGGSPGKLLGGLLAEGVQIVILVGLEKLIPGKAQEALEACGRKRADLSMGMAVGLIPIYGKVITEQKAVELLANVKCTVIGKGGLCGAEGATTLVAEGSKEEIKKLFDNIRKIKGSKTSASPESLQECKPGKDCPGDDLACMYKNPFVSSF